MVRSMAGKNKKLGKKGEDKAAEYLEKCGYRILERNFRCGRYGELDIVAEDGGYICFIEVKSRSSINFGLPCEAVNKAKQEKLRVLAFFYLDRNSLVDSDVRFDVVEVFYGEGHIEVNVIKNAF